MLPFDVCAMQVDSLQYSDTQSRLAIILMTRELCFRTIKIGLIGIISVATQVHAEDADRYRPYLRFHSGDVEPLWGTKDHYSIGLGANIDKYFGVELAFDYYLRDWGDPQNLAQVSSYHLVPEVRARYPLFNNRLVPYAVAGIGPSWLQSKAVDRAAESLNPRVEDFSYTIEAGGGLEYFIADNVTFGVEGKYLWVNPVDGTYGGTTEPVNLSTALFTFGLRIYFDENHPRPLVTEEQGPKDSRFYFGVRLGSDFVTDGHVTPGLELRPEQAAWGHAAGQTGGFLLGADFGEHWGVEVAGDSVNNLIYAGDLGGVAEYGQGWVLANLRYRYPIGRWQPYATIGAGGVYTEVKEYKAAAGNLNLDSKKYHPAVGVGAGVEYFITRNFSINGDVRWAYSWDHEFEMPGVVARGKGDISLFAATIGFRVYLFDY